MVVTGRRLAPPAAWRAWSDPCGRMSSWPVPREMTGSVPGLGWADRGRVRAAAAACPPVPPAAVPPDPGDAPAQLARPAGPWGRAGLLQRVITRFPTIRLYASLPARRSRLRPKRHRRWRVTLMSDAPGRPTLTSLTWSS